LRPDDAKAGQSRFVDAVLYRYRAGIEQPRDYSKNLVLVLFRESVITLQSSYFQQQYQAI